MSERWRERVFWLLSVAVLVVACAQLPRLARVPWPFGPESSKLLVLGVLLAGLPLTLAVHLVAEVVARAVRLRWPLPGMFFSNPAMSCEHESAAHFDDAEAGVRERLAALGFAPPDAETNPEGDRILHGVKAAATDGRGFLENGLAASVVLRRAPDDRTAVRATITQHGTVTLETGERDKLAQLAAYVALAGDRCDLATVPFSAYAALTLAWAGVLGLALLPSFSPLWGAALSGALLCGAIFAAMAGVMILRGRRGGQLFGLRIVATALLLCAVPFTVRASQDLRGVRVDKISEAQMWIVLTIGLMFGTVVLGEWRARRLANAGTAGGAGRRAVRRISWWGAAFALAMLAMGSSIWVESSRMTTRYAVSVSDLEAGAESPGKWLVVDGVLDEARSRWMARRNEAKTHFFPIVSRLGHEPVAAVLRVRDEALPRLVDDEGELRAVGPFEGVAIGFGLSDDERAQFVDNGIPLAAGCIEIEYGLTPAAFRRRALAPMWIGAGTLAAIAVLQLVTRLLGGGAGGNRREAESAATSAGSPASSLSR